MKVDWSISDQLEPNLIPNALDMVISFENGQNQTTITSATFDMKAFQTLSAFFKTDKLSLNEDTKWFLA